MAKFKNKKVKSKKAKIPLIFKTVNITEKYAYSLKTSGKKKGSKK